MELCNPFNFRFCQTCRVFSLVLSVDSQPVAVPLAKPPFREITNYNYKPIYYNFQIFSAIYVWPEDVLLRLS